MKIRNREELVTALKEAAAVEHMSLYMYLYAAYSLKKDVSEGLTKTQADMVLLYIT
jgi:ferritin-like protein